MADKVPEEPTVESSEGIISSVFNEIVQSPVNSLLVALIVVLIYKIFKNRDKTPVEEALPPALPKLRRDFTPSELREYSSKQADGRILVGINGHVFDVSKGRKFYGPGGPYANFAGHDATRGLATFSVDVSDKEYDDLSDLSAMEVDSAREWEMQFREKYELVGRLLKRGEEPTTYSDDETESEATTTEPKKTI